jgi:hypothetical protein
VALRWTERRLLEALRVWAAWVAGRRWRGICAGRVHKRLAVVLLRASFALWDARAFHSRRRWHAGSTLMCVSPCPASLQTRPGPRRARRARGGV